MRGGPPEGFLRDRPYSIQNRIHKPPPPFDRLRQDQPPQPVSFVKGKILISCPVAVPEKVERHGSRHPGERPVQASLTMLDQGLEYTVGQYLRPPGRGLREWPPRRL